MARNFSCGVSGLLCGANLETYTATLPDGKIESYGLVTAVTCASGIQNACSGQPTGSSQSFDTTWSSQYPNIAWVYGSNKSPGVNLQGMSLGTSNISAYLKSAYCATGGGGPVTVQACGTPTGETSASIRQNLTTAYAPTATDFQQSLVLASPLTAGSEYGAAIDEAENATGTDTCYFTGSAIPRQTAVTGGHWLVGEITPNFAESQVVLSGPGQWGPDVVGWNPGGVRYYQANRPKAGLPILCTVTYYQNVAITCPNQAPITFGANIPLTSTIDATGLTNCREGACSNHVSYQ